MDIRENIVDFLQRRRPIGPVEVSDVLLKKFLFSQASRRDFLNEKRPAKDGMEWRLNDRAGVWEYTIVSQHRIVPPKHEGHARIEGGTIGVDTPTA